MFQSSAFPGVDFDHENARIYADYWASLPKVDLIPMRDSFDPSAVVSILPTFVIHEMIAPDFIRVRLAGTAVAERFGFDQTGRNYFEHIPRERWPKIWRALSHIVERPCGMIVYIKSVRKSGLTLVSESVGFPFRDANGVANQVIYQANVGNKKPYYDYRADPLASTNSVRRVYLDIGAGHPDWRED